MLSPPGKMTQSKVVHTELKSESAAHLRLNLEKKSLTTSVKQLYMQALPMK